MAWGVLVTWGVYSICCLAHRPNVFNFQNNKNRKGNHALKGENIRYILIPCWSCVSVLLALTLQWLFLYLNMCSGSSLWVSSLFVWIRKAGVEIAHPSARSVYIPLFGCTPVPGQFWTMHDNITKQLGNVAWCSFLFSQSVSCFVIS